MKVVRVAWARFSWNQFKKPLNKLLHLRKLLYALKKTYEKNPPSFSILSNLCFPRGAYSYPCHCASKATPFLLAQRYAQSVSARKPAHAATTRLLSFQFILMSVHACLRMCAPFAGNDMIGILFQVVVRTTICSHYVRRRRGWQLCMTQGRNLRPQQRRGRYAGAA